MRTGSEMKLERRPSFRIEAANRAAPTISANVTAAAAACSGLISAATLVRAAPVSIPIVVVVLTLSVREAPVSVYTSIGARAVYNPSATGRPAIVAVAMVLGITTAAVVDRKSV